MAALVVLVWGARHLLDTAWARERVRQHLEDLAADGLGTTVSIGEVAFTLLPWTVELRDVRVGGGGAGDNPLPVLVEIPRALIDADLWALRANNLRLDRVVVERPVVHVAFLRDGRNNLFEPPDRPRDVDPRFEVFVGQLVIDDAEVVVDRQRIRLSLQADEARAALQGRGALRVHGAVGAERVSLDLPGGGRLDHVAVAGSASIERGGLRVEDTMIRGPGLRFRAGGGCTWRSGYKCAFDVAGVGDARLLRELGYFDGLTGRVSVDGNLVWRPGSVGWRSAVQATSVSLFGRSLRAVDGVLVADPQGIQLAVESARYAEGTLRGTVSYDLGDADAPVAVEVEASNLALAQVLRDSGVDVPRLGGRLNGPVRYRFVRGGSLRGSGGGSLRITADPTAPAHDVTLTGAFPIRIAEGVITSDAIALQSVEQSLLAQGRFEIGPGLGLFDYEIASRDVGELARLLPTVNAGDPMPLWQPTGGTGSVEGTLTARRAAGFESTLRVDLEAVEAPGLPASQQVAGTLKVTPTGLTDLRVEVGGARRALLVAGSVPFAATAHAATAPPLTLAIDAVDWPIDAVQPWLPWSLPLTGLVSGRLTLDGLASASSTGSTAGDAPLHGQLRATARAAQWRTADGVGAGPRVDDLSATLSWDQDRLRLTEITASTPAGLVTGSGHMDLASSAVDLRLEGAGLALDEPPLAGYRPRGDITGRVRLVAHVAGTLERPTFDIEADLADLRLAEERLGDGRLTGRWDGRTVALDAAVLDGWTLRGGGALDDREADLRFAFEIPALDPAFQLAAADLPGGLSGSLRGQVAVQGRLADGWPVPVATIDSLALALGTRRLRNRTPAVLRFKAQEVVIESLRVGEPGASSELRVTGRVGYRPEAPLALDIEGLMAAPWFQLAGLDGLEEGRLRLSGRVEGSRASPQPRGRGTLTGGRLVFPGDGPHQLDAMEASLRLSPEAVTLENMRATLGGGVIEASGRSRRPRPDGPFDQDEGPGAWRHRYQVAARQVNLLVPEGWSLLADGDLVLRSRADDGFEITGQAALARAEYRTDLPVGFAPVLSRLLARQRLQVEAASSVWSQTQLNVEMQTEGGLRVLNNLADLTGDADLVLRGTLAQPVIFGTVEIDPGSELVYNSTEYDVRRGRLTFANPSRMDPEVDLEATTRIREFDVHLALSGTVERMDARFSSEPPLPDLDVIQLLAGGEPVDSVAASVVRDLSDTGGASGASAAQFLYGQAASLVGERVGALFGLDTFRIDPLTGSGDALSRARVTVGKQLSKDVSVTYSADPSSTEEQRLQVEWHVGRNLVLVLTQNGDETYAADLRWEQVF